MMANNEHFSSADYEIIKLVIRQNQESNAVLTLQVYSSGLKSPKSVPKSIAGVWGWIQVDLLFAAYGAHIWCIFMAYHDILSECTLAWSVANSYKHFNSYIIRLHISWGVKLIFGAFLVIWWQIRVTI